MATVLAASPAPDQPPAAEELAVLHPERTLTFGGRAVTLREYGFFEGLEIADRASDFLADLVAASDDGHLRYAQVRRLFGRHRTVIPSIAAQAGDVEVAWLDALPPDELELYMATWFAVNTAFFVREMLVELRETRLLDPPRLAPGPSDGAICSSDSRPPGSATSIDSAA